MAESVEVDVESLSPEEMHLETEERTQTIIDELATDVVTFQRASEEDGWKYEEGCAVGTLIIDDPDVDGDPFVVELEADWVPIFGLLIKSGYERAEEDLMGNIDQVLKRVLRGGDDDETADTG